jgi:hypothetical protein
MQTHHASPTNSRFTGPFLVKVDIALTVDAAREKQLPLSP